MIDSNDTVFKYNKKANMYSMIEADYLMENKMESRNLFLFLSNDDGDNYFCRSFFRKKRWIILRIRHHGLFFIRKRQI